MQKLKTFVRTFWKSLTSPTYYKDVLNSRFSFAFKYFVFFHFLLALGVSVFAMIVLAAIPFSSIADQLLTNVPQDLVVHVENGQLSINQQLPYAVPMPTDWQNKSRMTRDGADIQNLVVFDTDQPVTNVVDFFQSYKTAVLVTQHFVYYRGNENTEEVRVTPIASDMKPVTFSSQELQQGKEWFFNTPLMKFKLYVPIVGAFLLVVLTPLMTFFNFITAAIYSVIMFVFVRFFQKVMYHGQQFRYKQVLKVSLVTLVPVLLVQMIFQHLSLGRINGELFFMIYAVMTGVALWWASQKVALKSVRSVAATPSRRKLVRPAKKSSRK